MERITMDIAPDGGVVIDAVGFSGPDCEQATKFLEDALGVVARKRKKPEYHQSRTRASGVQLKAGGGRT